MSCRHEIRFSGLCGQCGEPLPTTPSWHQPDQDQDDPDRDTVHILHGSLDLQVSRAEAERVETAVMNRLLAAKRLSLVIDLDQTLLHATMDPQVETWMADPLHPFHGFCDDIYRIELPEVGGSQMYQSRANQVYHVKLRPKVRQFLETATALFELHVYTMGSRAYARACCQILDPTGRLFHDRILSRDDAGLKGADSVHKKSLKRIFPHSSKMVLVLDDRGDVWRWAGNVVLVRPFLFYQAHHSDILPGGTVRYAAAAPRADAIVEGALEDDELRLSWNRLSFVHQQFFEDSHHVAITASTERDVAIVNDRLRRSVFDNLCVCLTGVIPKQLDGNGKPDILSLAESFGVLFVEEVREAVVVVVGRSGTDKHRRAAKFGIPAVSVEWLLQSCWSWQPLPYDLFLVDHDEDDTDLVSPEDTESTGTASSEELMETAPKRHKHDDADLLEWLDNELDGSEVSGDSDDIYGHSDSGSGDDDGDLE